DYGPEDDTWEPIRNLKNSLELIDQYHQEQQRLGLKPNLRRMGNAECSTRNPRRKAKRIGKGPPLRVTVCELLNPENELPPLQKPGPREWRPSLGQTSPSLWNQYSQADDGVFPCHGQGGPIPVVRQPDRISHYDYCRLSND
ncbi:hypothetical protein K469DRAFT_798857, partial [Zopfia rhizophila CBS 207.26]